MYTINDIKKMLGLSTTNQVRNRIQAVKNLLTGELRRGPNNQILLTEEGLKILKRLQDLYDSGLTITQASDVLRSSSDYLAARNVQVSPGLTRDQTNQGTSAELIAALQEEIAFLRARLTFLEGQLPRRDEEAHSRSWWEPLKEETDGP